jgi:hypothetical protein
LRKILGSRPNGSLFFDRMFGWAAGCRDHL